MIAKCLVAIMANTMMTSSNGNIFRVTGPLCGEFTGEFPAQRPMTRSFDVFFDLRLIKWLSKHSRCWWFETLSHPLWRHYNALDTSHTCGHTNQRRPNLWLPARLRQHGPDLSHKNGSREALHHLISHISSFGNRWCATLTGSRLRINSVRSWRLLRYVTCLRIGNATPSSLTKLRIHIRVVFECKKMQMPGQCAIVYADTPLSLRYISRQP